MSRLFISGIAGAAIGIRNYQRLTYDDSPLQGEAAKLVACTAVAVLYAALRFPREARGHMLAVAIGTMAGAGFTYLLQRFVPTDTSAMPPLIPGFT